MALITVSGEPGSRFEEAARLAAQRLHFELVTGVRLESMLEGEFGPSAPIPGRAWPDVAASVVARLTTEHHLVAAFSHAELLPLAIPGALRIAVVASGPKHGGSSKISTRSAAPTGAPGSAAPRSRPTPSTPPSMPAPSIPTRSRL